jgi:hypothetical protein
MPSALVFTLTTLTLIGACAIGHAQSPVGMIFQDGLEAEANAPIAWRSDEFDAPQALSRFQQIWRRESWPFDSLQRREITNGHLMMVPYSSGWWEDYRAELTYQEITGDFVVTTAVQPRNRVGLDAGTGAPGSTSGGAFESEYSLGGLMIRAPRPAVELSNSNWQRGGEAYVFLAMGGADEPGVYKFEDKTTTRNPNPPNPSQSVRLLTSIAPPTNSAYLRIVRIGVHVILLVQNFAQSPCCAQPWQVLRRYRREDFPARLQVGFVAYTDWATMRQCSYEFHNHNRLLQSCASPALPADPDLAVRFDFYRLMRPDVPTGFEQADWSNPIAISDQQIINVFGASP